ncbi:hypothetical protein FHG87_010721 [Trinorchestia longiramus]|nr:hypothetical protein FHG87_010721 [Trinorchestia longiramus]
MVRVVQVCLFWIRALPTLALLCVASEASNHKGSGDGLAVEGHQFDDRDPAFQGTTRDHRSVPKTQGGLQDSQTADTSHRQWSRRIDSNNRPQAYRSNRRTLDGRAKVGNWYRQSSDTNKKAGFSTYDYEDYYHDLGSVLEKSDYDPVNLNLNYEYDTQYEDYMTPFISSKPDKVGFRRTPFTQLDAFIQPQQSWSNLRSSRPGLWEAVTNNFTPAQSHEKGLNVRRRESSAWVLPQSQFIDSVPKIPMKMSSLPRIRDTNFASKYPVQNVGGGFHASPFQFSGNLSNDNRGKKKKKKLSSNPFIRMREFLLGGDDEVAAQEKKDDNEQFGNKFHRSVARGRTLKDESIYSDSGKTASILLVLNQERDNSIATKSSVSKQPLSRSDMNKKSSTKPFDFDKTEQGEPLIVIDVEKVTKFVQDDSSIRPEDNKKPPVNKNTASENTRKPLENVDYSVPVLPPRLPHIEEYYGSLGNQDAFLLSSPAADILGSIPNLPEDIPLMYSDELYGYNLKNDYVSEAHHHEQTSHSKFANTHKPFRAGSLFNQHPPHSSGRQRVHSTLPKKIKIKKTGIKQSYPYKLPRPYGHPQTYSPYPPVVGLKPYVLPQNPSPQLPYGNHGHKPNPPLKLPYQHHKDTYNSGHAYKNYDKGSSLIILESTFPKGNNYFPKETGIYEYEHESISIPPYDRNPYVKKFDHFLPKDDHKDVLLEYTANNKEDIKGVALLIARENKHKKSLAPYEIQTHHSSYSRRRNFDEANSPKGDGAIYIAQLDSENETSNIPSAQLYFANKLKSPAENLGQLEDEISRGGSGEEKQNIASGSFSSLEEWTEDSSTIIKSGGGSIPLVSEEM